jgi:hypothetical protein
VLFDATMFERVFFKTEDYNVYLDLTYQFIDLLDNEKRFLSKTSFACHLNHQTKADNRVDDLAT